MEPTGGSVHFDGTDLLALDDEQMRRMRRQMQMVFQDPMASLDPRQDVESVLTEPLRAHRIEGDHRARARELLDLVGLPATALSRYPHEFSGGQRQRIGIARAIALEPQLIVLVVDGAGRAGQRLAGVVGEGRLGGPDEQVLRRSLWSRRQGPCCCACSTPVIRHFREQGYATPSVATMRRWLNS